MKYVREQKTLNYCKIKFFLKNFFEKTDGLTIYLKNKIPIYRKFYKIEVD